VKRNVSRALTNATTRADGKKDPADEASTLRAGIRSALEHVRS
jgi:hypothetical protein